MQQISIRMLVGVVLACAACADGEGRDPFATVEGDGAAEVPEEDDAGASKPDSAMPPPESDAESETPDGSLDDEPDARSADAGDATAADASALRDTAVTDPSTPDAGQGTPDAALPNADAGQGDAGPGTPDASPGAPDASTPPQQVGGTFTFTVTQDPGELKFDPDNTQNRYAGAELAVDLGTLDPGTSATVQIRANASGYADSDWFKFRLGGNYRNFDTFMGSRTGIPMGTQVFLTCDNTPGCYPAMTEDRLFGKIVCSQYLNPSVITPLQLGEYVGSCTNPLVYLRVISFDESSTAKDYTVNLDVIPLQKSRLSCTYPQRGGCTD